MCGIAALIGNVPEALYFENMLEAVHHRGPDATGIQTFFCHNKEVAHLGHKRLTILDLSKHGNQPMASKDGRFHITFNGEIYNYIELREELKAKGVEFCTQTDTEVLLAAYEEWGKKCLPKLNGMFAFVIYDQKSHSFFAARDRFGIKPLYLWKSSQKYIAFASEIKQFLKLPGFSSHLNHQRAYDYLNWAIHDHTRETLFSEVQQLRGGEYVEGTIESHQTDPVKWYNPKSNLFTGTLADAARIYKNLLQDSITLRLRSDVSIGSCLSGGLDSSSIVCIMNDLLKEKGKGDVQSTFSACSKVHKINEKPFIDLVVEQTKHLSFATIPESKQLIKDLDRLIWHQDEPFETTSVFAQWEVFKLASTQKVKVMLDGQGADEQLAGYTGCYGPYFSTLFRSLRFKKLLYELSLSKPTLSHVNPYVMLASKLVPRWLRAPLAKLARRRSIRPDWLSFTRLHAEDRSPFLDESKFTLTDHCNQMIFTTSLPMLLHFEDRDSMAHSIEARTPFLDYRLVDFTLSLPCDYRISDGTTKRVLREAMKETIPKGILERRDKIGFATAEEVWLREPIFRDLLIKGIEQVDGIVKPKVLPEYDRWLKGEIPFTNKFWRVICFGRWLDRFNVTF